MRLRQVLPRGPTGASLSTTAGRPGTPSPSRCPGGVPVLAGAVHDGEVSAPGRGDRRAGSFCGITGKLCFLGPGTKAHVGPPVDSCVLQGLTNGVADLCR